MLFKFAIQSGCMLFKFRKSFSFSQTLSFSRQLIMDNVQKNKDAINDGFEDLKSINMSEEMKFDETFHKIRQFLTESDEAVAKPVSDWFNKVLLYNVPHGKKFRGMTVLKSYCHFVENPIDEKMELARILGWCIEIFQAFFLVLDDIMDQSYTRRNQPCWYRKADVGLIAINDALLLQCGIYTILKKYFIKNAHYLNMVHLLLDMTRLTVYGQCLDLLSEKSDTINFEEFTMEKYLLIAKNKTSYYSFSLPVRLALYLSGKDDSLIHEKIEKILIEIGILFQIQDDYLDCYGDPKIIGKIGIDIECGKCCWLVVMAIKYCDEKQIKVLKNNYGKSEAECIKTVKKLYENLGIEEKFKKYEEASYHKIQNMIKEFHKDTGFDPSILNVILDTIYQRKK